MDLVVETRSFPRTHDIFRRHNGIGALDANGISSIIIGVITVLIAFAGLVGGIKCWKKRVQRRVYTERNVYLLCSFTVDVFEGLASNITTSSRLAKM